MANLYSRKKSISFSSQNKPSPSVFLRGLGLSADTTIFKDGDGLLVGVDVAVKSALGFYTLQQKFTDFGLFLVVDSVPTEDVVTLKSVCDFYEYLRVIGFNLTDEYLRSGILEYKTTEGRTITVKYMVKFTG